MAPLTLAMRDLPLAQTAQHWLFHMGTTPPSPSTPINHNTRRTQRRQYWTFFELADGLRHPGAVGSACKHVDHVDGIEVPQRYDAIESEVFCKQDWRLAGVSTQVWRWT